MERYWAVGAPVEARPSEGGGCGSDAFKLPCAGKLGISIHSFIEFSEIVFEFAGRM